MKQPVQIKGWLCILGLGSLLVLVLAINSKKSQGNPFYFDREPFVNPKIIQDLTTWLSDTGDQVIAIDLLGAQDSNRYNHVSRIPLTHRGVLVESDRLELTTGTGRMILRRIMRTNDGLPVDDDRTTPGRNHES